MRGMPDFAAPRTWEQPPKRGFPPWIVVVALLVLALAGGWLLLRGHNRDKRAPASPMTPDKP